MGNRISGQVGDTEAKSAILLVFGLVLTIAAFGAVWYNIDSSALGVEEITRGRVAAPITYFIGIMITVTQIVFWVTENKEGLEVNEVFFFLLSSIDWLFTYYRINGGWWNSAEWVSNFSNGLLVFLFFSIGAEVILTFGMMTVIRNMHRGGQGLKNLLHHATTTVGAAGGSPSSSSRRARLTGND